MANQNKSICATTCHGLCNHLPINQNSTEATICLCPFEDKDVWSPTWRHLGKFNLRLLSPEQRNQIFSYFAEPVRAIAEAKRQGNRRIAANHIYRFPLKSLAAYFNVQPTALRQNVVRSRAFNEFLEVSSQDASDATASVMECIPAIQGAEVAQVQFAQVAAGNPAIGDGGAGDDRPISAANSALGKRPAPQWNEIFCKHPTDLFNARRDGEYPACSKYRESQLRDRPGSFLKKFRNSRSMGKELVPEGCLLFPIASADYAEAPIKSPMVFSAAREEDFAVNRDAIGYTLVRLVEDSDAVLASGSEAENGFKKFVRDAHGSDSREEHPIIGTPLFLDHLDKAQECVRHLKLSDFSKHPTHYGDQQLVCKELAASEAEPTILIDQAGMRFDTNRYGAGAKAHSGLSAAASAVHKLVVDNMPPQFRSNDYEPSRTYKADHASALATMRKALRQNFHVDTYKEGFSVLVAVESDFRLVVLENSLQLIRRVAELWDIFTESHKSVPADVDAAEWWDYCCWRQLQEEGRVPAARANLFRAACYPEPRNI
jgi:hypothetical protein